MLYEVITEDDILDNELVFESDIPEGELSTVLKTSRITSYNVCYTKLLRLQDYYSWKDSGRQLFASHSPDANDWYLSNSPFEQGEQEETRGCLMCGSCNSPRRKTENRAENSHFQPCFADIFTELFSRTSSWRDPCLWIHRSWLRACNHCQTF